MIFKRLVKLANQLDAKGQYKLADKMEKSANAATAIGQRILPFMFGDIGPAAEKILPDILREIAEVAPQKAMSVIDRLAANLKRYHPNMTQEQILQELKLMNLGRLNEAAYQKAMPAAKLIAPEAMEAMSVIDRRIASLQRYFPNKMMTDVQRLKAKNLIGYYPNLTDQQIFGIFNGGATKFFQPELLQDFYQQRYRLPISNQYLWQNTPGSVKALGLGGLGAAALMWPRGPQSTGYNNPTSPKSYNQFDQTQIAGYDLRTGKPWYKGQPAPRYNA